MCYAKFNETKHDPLQKITKEDSRLTNNNNKTTDFHSPVVF